MKKVTLETLARRVISDPTFRGRFMADPALAISEAGWDLPPQEIQALKTWHAHVRDVTKLDELERSLSAFLAEHHRHAA